MAPLGRATPEEAAPDAASLGTIISQSTRCQAHIGNKIHKYRKLFMIDIGKDRVERVGPCILTPAANKRLWRFRLADARDARP